MSKKLIVDMSNQKKTLTLVSSADASDFYDRVAHPFAFLTAQQFILNLQCALLLLKIMQSMNISFQTTRDTCSTTYSSPLLKIFQGVMQGKGADQVL